MEGGFFNAASDVGFARLELTLHLAGHLFDCAMEASVFSWQGGGKVLPLDPGGLCLNVGGGGLIEGNLNMDVIVLDFWGRIVFVIRSGMVVVRYVRLGMLNFLRSLVLNRRIKPRSRNCRAILRVLRELLLF